MLIPQGEPAHDHATDARIYYRKSLQRPQKEPRLLRLIVRYSPGGPGLSCDKIEPELGENIIKLITTLFTSGKVTESGLIAYSGLCNGLGRRVNV